MPVELIYGRIGAGKSSLIQALTAPYDRVIYCDRLGELPGDKTVHSYPEDAETIDWEAEKLRVLWTAPVDWRFLSSLSDIALVLEEADMHWPGAVIRDPDLANLIARNRHYGIDLFVVSQRPKQTPPLVRSVAHRVYCLALAIVEDKAYVRGSWGIEPPSKPYVYKCWRPEDSEHEASETTGPTPREQETPDPEAPATPDPPAEGPA